MINPIARATALVIAPRRAIVFAAVVVTAAFACGYVVGVATAVVRGPDRYGGVANSR